MALDAGQSGKVDQFGQTRLLARFASNVKYSKLPLEIIVHAKACVLDSLGSILLGFTQPWGKIMLKYVESLGDKTESAVIGSHVKVSAGNAALANGTMAHGFEVDDVYMPAVHHPGAVIVPGALAAAEREGASGKDFLAAVVAGYEVMNRVGDATTESHIMRGFFPTGTNGVFGAAASAGNLLHLTEDQMISALGVAGNQAAGVNEGIREGSMTKRFGAGRAAQSGLLAADLARMGFLGPETILEGKWGYLTAYSDKKDLSQLTHGLGEDYNIKNTIFKPYPCCKALHAVIDGVLLLQKEHRFGSEEVQEIVVGGYEKLVSMHDIYEPTTPMAAQFSIPYVISTTLLRGEPGLEAFSEKSIRDEKVIDFGRKVKIVVDPEVAPYFPAYEPGKVTVKLKDGSSYFKTVIHSKGTPHNPMSRKELETKFKGFASLVISEKQAEEAIEIIERLETLNNLTDLSSLLCKKI